MSFDNVGNHSLPDGTIVQTGDKVLPSQHNPAMQDISASLSAVLKKDGRDGMVGPLNMGSFPITNVAVSQTVTSAATVGQVQGIVPLGTVFDYILPLLPPNFLWANGAAILPSSPYATFRQALLDAGAPYGTDGDGNPLVIDLRGRTTAGRDNMGGTDAGRLSTFFGAVARTLGGMLGTASHALTVAEGPQHSHAAGGLLMPSHAHPGILPARLRSTTGGTDTARLSFGNTDGAAGTLSWTTELSGTASILGSTANSGSGTAHPNAQPTGIVNKIILASY